MRATPIFILLLFSSCLFQNSDDDFRKLCPYDFERAPAHCLRVPVTFTPHQSIYNVGDTLRISTIFSDSIEDLCTLNTFEIEGWPFRPLSQLYRFTDATTWDSGFRVNEIMIDSLYGISYRAFSMWADQFISTTIFEDDEYHFQFELILEQPGRYIFTMTDNYEATLRGGSGPDPNAEANAVTFEGKCPNIDYTVYPMVDSGDDHLDDFFGELEHLDSTTFLTDLGSIREHRRSLNYTGSGVKAEFNAFYGFEVVE